MKTLSIKNEYKRQLSKRYRAQAFSSLELRNAEKLLRHIEQFSSPRKEEELVKFVLAQNHILVSNAA